MSKLFKHINENIFKLTEWDGDEIYDLEYDDELISYPKENNLKRISKLEEQEGFNFIIKYIIPIAVNHWNQMQLENNRKDFVVTSRDVSRHIKKQNVYRAPPWNPSLKLADKITYVSHMTWLNPPPTSFNRICAFQFNLYKDPERNFKLFTDWSHSFYYSSRNYAVVVNPFHQLKEEPNDDINSDELNEVIEDPSLKISKQEEEIAFHFIKRIVVPLDVEKHNKEIDRINTRQGKNYQLSHVKVEDVLKNLRKTEDYYIRLHGQHIIKYEAAIPDPHPKIGHRNINRFFYTIYKSIIDKKLMVMAGQHSCFDVNKSISTDKMKFVEKLNENNYTKQSFYISKMEEQFGLRLIIKYLVPMAVRHYNSRVNKEIRGQKQYINTKDTIRTLKKIKDNWDEKEYVTDQDHGGFRFGISKKPQTVETSEGIKGVLCIGEWNITSYRSWYWYATDHFVSSIFTRSNEKQKNI